MPVFPTNLFDQLPVLSNVTASRAGIRNISSLGDQNAKKVDNMRTLILTENKLATLGSMAFYRLHRLTFLDVSFNQITDIEKDAFNGLSELNQLILSSNSLQTLTNGVFSPLVSLKKLEILRNQLTELDLDQFSGITNVLDISATLNKIETITAEKANRLIGRLAIGYNQLEDISNLTRLQGLKSLYLYHNPVVLEGDFFEKMPQLNVLVLDATNLRQLNGNFTLFAPLQSLDLLSLSDNNLGTFEVAKFPKLPELTQLFLDGNNLTTLDFENFETIFPKLEKIEITKNRFECVFLKFMVEHFERIKVQLELFNKAKPSSAFSVQDVECVVHSGDTIRDLSSRVDTMMAVFSDMDWTANKTKEYLETAINKIQEAKKLLEDSNSTNVQRQLNELRQQFLEDRASADNSNMLLWATVILGLLISSVLAVLYVYGRIKTKLGGTDKLQVAYSRSTSEYDRSGLL
jgi:Leucine-rich repeat (LRR) protein